MQLLSLDLLRFYSSSFWALLIVIKPHLLSTKKKSVSLEGKFAAFTAYILHPPFPSTLFQPILPQQSFLQTFSAVS